MCTCQHGIFEIARQKLFTRLSSERAITLSATNETTASNCRQTAYRLCMPSCAQQRPIYLPVLLDSARTNLIGQFNGISPNNTELSPCIALIKFSCKDRATSRLDSPPLPFFPPQRTGKRNRASVPPKLLSLRTIYLNINIFVLAKILKQRKKETIETRSREYFSKEKWILF